MENSPVQIVLNSGDFIEAEKNNGGGPSTDFFAGHDSDFVAHKSTLQKQLSEIRSVQLSNEFTSISYAKVTLQQAALAKSHRPTDRLFVKNIAPVVGAGDLGEIYVELTPNSVDELNKKISEAPAETSYKEVNGKMKPNPGKLRSEVGSIREISAYGANDKRKFSLKEALEWFSNPQTGGIYVVELFDVPPVRKDWDLLALPKRKLFSSFYEGLEKLGKGLVVNRTIDNASTSVSIVIKFEISDAPPIIQLQPVSLNKSQSRVNKISTKQDSHSELLDFLDKHPLVKSVKLPPTISQALADSSQVLMNNGDAMPVFNPDISYPKICVVDGGVSDILSEWIELREGYISPSHKDESHGTFISGLTIFGKTLNGDLICPERDGCRIIDLDLFPSTNFSDYYKDVLTFFEVLSDRVQDIVSRTGVRIFNFSLNIEEHASTTGYSWAAQILDKIAEDNDVIFIISAGNINPHYRRREWPSDHVEALKVLVSSLNDTIMKPAESSRNISVSALNPPHIEGIVPYALSNYSCRGPGMKIGLKPDLAHVGGSGTVDESLGHGLLSIDTLGRIIDSCGTSYAAPNVSKTLASIEHSIEGLVSRETLIALGIHHASLPEHLTDKKLKSISKHLVGFGIPKGSDEILNGNPNAITLVFANRIIKGHKMRFKFSWPSSLVKNGKCVGRAKLTIVGTPPFNYTYGAEFIRINVDAALRQQQIDGKYKGRLKPIYTPEEKDLSQNEKDQIEHAFKWSPVKVYENVFPQGVGPTTDWTLDVEYLERDGAVLPREGVPFTAILTISDPNEKEPVFNDMRQILQSLGVQAVDIKTAARIVPRV